MKQEDQTVIDKYVYGLLDFSEVLPSKSSSMNEKVFYPICAISNFLQELCTNRFSQLVINSVRALYYKDPFTISYESTIFSCRHLTQLAATLNKELNREQGGTSPGVIFSFWAN